MSGFAEHGITHLSPSSINLWINAPDVWVAEKLFKRRGAPSPVMKRGLAVEAAAVAVLAHGQSVEDAAENAAREQFDSIFTIGDETTAKQRALIQPMTEQAVSALAPYGLPCIPEGKRGQHKIKLTCKGEGWDIDVIGFLDFVYPDHGLTIDLKSTERCPSVMTPEHQVQRCVYAKARGNEVVKFLYVTPKKAALLEDGDVNETLARFKIHAMRLERLLRGRSREEIAAIIPVNPSSFYWRGNEEARRELYGV